MVRTLVQLMRTLDKMPEEVNEFSQLIILYYEDLFLNAILILNAMKV